MRKYKFKSRAEAEQAYEQVDKQRLLAEWFASALLRVGAVRITGNRIVDNVTETFGYVKLRHHDIVFWVHNTSDTPHRIRGLWYSDDTQLNDIVSELVRHEDSHKTGLLLDQARLIAYQAVA